MSSVTLLGGPQTATCPNNRQCLGLIKKLGEQGEQRGRGGWEDQAKNHRKTEHNRIRQGQNPAFMEMYDVSLEDEWASPLNLPIGDALGCVSSLNSL